MLSKSFHRNIRGPLLREAIAKPDQNSVRFVENLPQSAASQRAESGCFLTNRFEYSQPHKTLGRTTLSALGGLLLTSSVVRQTIPATCIAPLQVAH